MSRRFEIRMAEPRDSAALIKLIDQTPQDGQVRLNFERNPDFFYATHVTTTAPEIWVMIDIKNNVLLASFSIGTREVFVNGKARVTRYGNDLRIHKDYRGGRTLISLFKKYREVMQNEWMQTVILDDNKASINSVGSGRLSLPTYYKAGQFQTHMVDLRRKQYKADDNSTISIRRASEDDKAAMQTFFDLNAPLKEFYPCYDFSAVGTDANYYRGISIEDYFLAYQERELIGVCGVWDQKSFKQTRFVAYEGRMKALRYVNNLKNTLFGGLQLPKAGAVATYLSLHSILCEGNDLAVFEALLNTILKTYHATKYEALIFGFDIRDPLNQASKGLKAYQLLSNHYLASYHSDPSEMLDPQRIFYLEPSRL